MSKPTSPAGAGLTGHSVRLLRSLAGLAVFGLLAVRWYTTHQAPRVTIPDPVMPTPNAFDFYVKAGNAITEDRKLRDVVSSAPTVRYTYAQKEALVRENAGVIDTLHQGAVYRYRNPPVRSLFAETPYYAKFRDVAHLLALRGDLRAEEGDWNGATESYLDAIQMGEEIPHGSPVIGALAGIACRSIGLRPMWKTVDHLNAAQSRAAAQRLQTLMGRHFLFAASLQEEKWLGQAELMLVFHSSSNPVGAQTADSALEPSKASMANIVFFFYSKKRIMHDYTVYMDRNARQAQQPYSLHLPPPHEPTDPINLFILPFFSYAWVHDTNSETQNGLLQTTLALHAFRLEHGRYPNTLAELAPGYLKRLPDDPFAASGTFHYALKGQSYLLYSVGPDSKDDGGTPIYDTKKQVGNHPEARYSVEQGSIGDIVTGKNL